MNFEVLYDTDKGPVRAVNQDAYCLRIGSYFCRESDRRQVVGMVAVCDGMGGLSEGEIASATMISGLAEWFDSFCSSVMAAGSHQMMERVTAEWKIIVEAVHKRLMVYGSEHRIKLGTTVTAVFFNETDYVIMQVGDSRLYMDTEKECSILTRDQTVAMREFDRGNLSADEFLTDKRRSILLQCIGERECIPVFTFGSFPETGAFLLCSDGFYHNLNSQALHLVLAKEWDEVSRYIKDYQKSLLRAGESDNRTVVFVRWRANEETPAETKLPETENGEQTGQNDILDIICRAAGMNAEPLFVDFVSCVKELSDKNGSLSDSAEKTEHEEDTVYLPE